MHRLLIAGGVALGLAGCASGAPEVTVAYVSPIRYETYTCEQLDREAERMSTRTPDEGSRQPAVAMVIPWPAASLGRGSGGFFSEPGQLERIVKASAAKQCTASPQPRSG